jgi:hypothetical protein
MIPCKHNPRPALGSALRLLGGRMTLLVLALACKGGGGDGRPPVDPAADLPSFTGALSPRTVYWGTRGARFVITGGQNLAGKSFTAKLGFLDGCVLEDCPTDDVDCQSATVDPSDPTQLDVVCDIPEGGRYGWTFLNVLYEGRRVFGFTFDETVSFEWPPSSEPASLAGASVSPLTWGTSAAPVVVTGGRNLPGHALTATLDGLPCSSAYLSPEDPTQLSLSCSTRPGGQPGTASLVVQEDGATIAGGELAVDVAACRTAGPAADGVPLPLLCDAPPGSTSAPTSSR